MTRYFVVNDEYEIAWGHDHVDGFFLQITDLEDNSLVVDKDWKHDRLMPRDIADIAAEYGADENDILYTLRAD